jgi:prevent-host-death family protein
MVELMKPEDIEPITALKRDAATLIDRASQQRAPIVITQNGRATAVLQDVQSFAEERRAFALLKLAMQGEREIIEGHRLSHAQHRRRARALLDDLKRR